MSYYGIISELFSRQLDVSKNCRKDSVWLAISNSCRDFFRIWLKRSVFWKFPSSVLKLREDIKIIFASWNWV